MSFTEQDYRAAAMKLAALPIREVKAVVDVESNGVTRWPDGTIPIRLEAHRFSALTGGRFDASHPHISSPAWNPALAARSAREAWDQFAQASQLDGRAAIMATSWGAFQVMGENWLSLGYDSPEAFMLSMNTDAGQIDAFVRYVLVNHLDDDLRNHDWRTFASGYNGPGQVDHYAQLINDAFERGTMPAFAFDVAELQRRLGVPADGQFGPVTKSAVMRFQSEHGLVPDGIVGPLTRGALGL